MVEANFEAQAFADDVDQHVNRDRDPDLRLHGVFADAVEGLDAQVLLDPLEEPLHLPALFVDLGDGECGKREVVREEDKPLAGFSIYVTDLAQRVWISGAGLVGGQDDRLV